MLFVEALEATDQVVSPAGIVAQEVESPCPVLRVPVEGTALFGVHISIVLVPVE